jgi:hypothetical protein
MKKLQALAIPLAILALGCFAGLMPAALAAATPTSVAFTWTNVSNGAVPCSATVTSNCIKGQTLSRTDGTAVVLSSTIGATDTSYTWTPSGGLPTGKLAFSLVVNYLDVNGAAQVTAAATTTVGVSIAPSAPSGFSAVEQ